jgi:ATP-dependent protease ClpP protease subunit
VFEVRVGRIRTKMTFATPDVVRIEEGALPPPPKPKGSDTGPTSRPAKLPGFFVIPVKGTFGTDVTGELLEKCLTMAKYRKPAAVILEVNSPGGSVRELQRLIKVLEKFKDMRIVAYVEKAHSAAAILSMACKEIVMGPKATIGGAKVFQLDVFGIPSNIEEKFASILRAEFRSAVKRAGHNHLFLKAMMDERTVLSLKTGKDGPVVVEGSSKDTEIIKRRGEILTMTTDEAMKWGLAAGSAESAKTSNKVLGIAKWTEQRNNSQKLFAKWKKELADAEAEYKQLLEQAKILTDKAAVHDPDNYAYMVTSSGRLTPASRAKWIEHAKQCIACCAMAEARLKRMTEIATKYYPLVEFGRLEFGKEVLDLVKRQLGMLRQRVQGGPPE